MNKWFIRYLCDWIVYWKDLCLWISSVVHLGLGLEESRVYSCCSTLAEKRGDCARTSVFLLQIFRHDIWEHSLVLGAINTIEYWLRLFMFMIWLRLLFWFPLNSWGQEFWSWHFIIAFEGYLPHLLLLSHLHLLHWTDILWVQYIWLDKSFRIIVLILDFYFETNLPEKSISSI